MRSQTEALLTAVLIVVASTISISCGSIGRVNRPTVTGDPCAQADWFEVGRLDGLQGIQEETSAYVGRCRRYLNEELYLAGWNRGLVDFCTPERAFDAGRSGLDYADGICPAHAEPTFLQAFKKGRELLKIERENVDLESQIDRLRRLLDSPDTTGMSVVPQVSHDLQKLRDRRARNEELVRAIENARRL